MARIPQAFIDDLLDRADIVDVVGSRVDLRKTGKNYSARCPFHDEKTPSFTVSPDKQFYYCFGCGAGGNALGFVMDYDQLPFVDAVESLARHCGLEVPRETGIDDGREGHRKQLYAILEAADRFYRNQLRQHSGAKIAVDYLKGRGLTGQITSTFGIGYAPPGWDNLIRALASDDSQLALLKEAGLVVDRDDEGNRVYDRFRNRIIFPIRNTRGKTIAFGGRVLGDDKPKYLNSPETPVFHKGRELYGLHEALRELKEVSRLLVVEGYMDVVALAQHGIRNAVATLGTAATPEHLEKLFRYSPEVVFCFDGDAAGRNAARRALDTCLPVMSDGRSARFLFLPEGEDPDSLVRRIGAEEFGLLVKAASSLSTFLFDAVGDSLDLTSLDDRARLSQLAAPMINRMPRGVYRQLMLKQLGKITGMETDRLELLIAPPPPLPPDTAPESFGETPPDWTDLPPEDWDQDEPPDGSFGERQPLSRGGRASGSLRRPLPRPGATAPTRRLKLRPLHQLIALLANQPALATELGDLSPLEALDDPEVPMLMGLLELFHQHPEYTLNHILGYWRGIHGPEQGELLARIAANDLLQPQASRPRDNLAELNDIHRHLMNKVRHHRPHQQRLAELLAQDSLSTDDRKILFDIWHSRLSAEERTPELNNSIKQALARPNQTDYK